VPLAGILPPAESEPFELKHAVHSLGAEDFELLVALIYQRQGYRVSMPAGLSGGRGGDFTLLRKSERVLVQCKKLNLEHRVPVERVRELHEAMVAAGLTRGMYVASCGFTWDARNFAKGRGVNLINARTLDALIAAAREKPDEDLLAVSQWVPKLMSKVELTTPHCPACEAKMDQINVSDSSVWVCSQRPECRGRRSARKHQKRLPAAAPKQNFEAQRGLAVNGESIPVGNRFSNSNPEKEPHGEISEFSGGLEKRTHRPPGKCPSARKTAEVAARDKGQ